MTEQTFTELLEKAVREPGVISTAYNAFHGYSMGNQLLALFQCQARGIPIGPIASFMGWKDKGRHVLKGAKAISLCMPVTCKSKRIDKDGDDPTDATFTRFVYRNNWFVLAQTEGAPVEPIAIAEWDADRALQALEVKRIAFESLDGNAQGYALERSIAVSPVAALPHKTLFHELAHVLLGHTAEGAMSDDDRTPRDLREVEAETVAMVCCEALALPGADFSRGYIQHWNATRGNEPIPERSAQKIFKAADQILKAGRGDTVHS